MRTFLPIPNSAEPNLLYLIVSPASTALTARGSPRPAIASCCQAFSSAGYRLRSRHQPPRGASSIADVTINACSCAAAVER